MDSPLQPPSAPPLSQQGAFPSECLQTEERPVPIPGAPQGAGFQQGLEQHGKRTDPGKMVSCCSAAMCSFGGGTFTEEKENTEGCLFLVFLPPFSLLRATQNVLNNFVTPKFCKSHGILLKAALQLLSKYLLCFLSFQIARMLLALLVA